MEIGTHELIDGFKIIVEVALAFVVMKMKLEVAEIKIWILQNFEQRKKPRE